MKTKLKYFSLAIAALLMVGFASCSSDDDTVKGVEEDETISVMLKLDLGTTTRAEVAPVATGTKAKLNTADVYFATSQGAIVKHVKVATGEITNLTTVGITVTDLPGNTTQVFVFGNSPLTLPTAGPIKSVKDKLIGMSTQTDIDNVNLYGHSDTFTDSGNTTAGTGNKIYNVAVQIKPTVSRIEIAEIVATQSLTGFNVVGIFVDNYYKQATSEGKVNSSDLSELYTQNNAALYVESTDGTYIAANEGMNYDVFTSPGKAAVDKIAKPTGTDVWGYNLFAQTDVSVVPRIVIQLNAVTATTESGIGFGGVDQYLTIKGFRNEGETETLATIAPGKIYKITKVEFCSKDLAPAPNQLDRDVIVTVAVVDWLVETVIADI